MRVLRLEVMFSDIYDSKVRKKDFSDDFELIENKIKDILKAERKKNKRNKKLNEKNKRNENIESESTVRHHSYRKKGRADI